MTHRFWIRIASACVALATLAGCGHGGGKEATSTTAATATTSGAAPATTGESWVRPETPPDPQTLLHAGSVAVATVPGSTLVFIASETDDAGTWKVRVATADGTAQQVKVGADGVTVLVDPTPTNDSDADKAKRRADIAAARLDYSAAVDKMLAAVPNGSITRLHLDEANGVTVWEAHVWDTYVVGHLVTVNAVSGDLIGNKQV
ncbi:MAG TPA: metallopeptidase [Mycobacterium sp.]